MPELPKLNNKCYMGELIKTSNDLKIKIILSCAFLINFKIIVIIIIVTNP